MYGYNEPVAPTAGGHFGLNKNVTISKFEYNPNAGKEGAAAEALDVVFMVGEKEFRKRIFPIGKVFAKNGGEITDTTSASYKTALAKEFDTFNATNASIVSCFIPKDALKASLATLPAGSGFKEYAMLLQRLVQSVQNWNTKPLDLFLQYQWGPSSGQTVTFLEVPKNLNQGIFVVPAVPGDFTEDRTETHLRYVDAAGNVHPIARGDWFVKSNFANRIDLSATPSGSAGYGGAAPQAPAATNW